MYRVIKIISIHRQVFLQPLTSHLFAGQHEVLVGINLLEHVHWLWAVPYVDQIHFECEGGTWNTFVVSEG